MFLAANSLVQSVQLDGCLTARSLRPAHGDITHAASAHADGFADLGQRHLRGFLDVLDPLLPRRHASKITP